MEPRSRRTNETWFTEESSNDLRLSLRITKELMRKESRYQSILAVETAEYGRMMALDGAIQVTEKDEFCYHEMMAHVGICAHPKPEKVLVVGGGDGGSLREAVKHSSVKKVVMVDIDEEVINTSREYFPTLSCSMDDPKAEIHPMDALIYMKDHQGEFDVIIVDAPDPVDMAAGLFESPFYRDVYNALSDDGIMITHIESPFTDAQVTVPAYKAMKEVFPSVTPFLGFMPTYPSGMWLYVAASKKHDVKEPLREAPDGLKYYTSEIHRGCFALPPFVKDMLDGDSNLKSNY